MNWKIENSTVYTPTGKQLQFKFNIRRSMECDGILIVILGVPPEESMPENVFGISNEGILWQIEKNPRTSLDSTNRFVGFLGRRDSIVRIANWNTIVCDVSIYTGQITSTEFTK